jgi:hypothetical protein
LAAPLINLAILETLKSVDCRDEIDLFVPFIAIAIKNLSEIPFTGEILKDQLLKDFGINAPTAAIDVLLSRAKRKKLVRIEHHAYFPISENLTAWSDEYSSRSGEVEEAIDLISNEFVIFTHGKYGKTISQDDAISLLYEFLRKNIGDSAILATAGRTNSLDHIKNSSHLTASFIAHVHRSKREHWSYFEIITRAIMLAGYLTYADQISSRNQYTNMTVYLDTPIILGILGYSGESKSKTLIELLSVLSKHGVDVAIFYETLREIENILHAWAQDLSIKRYDRFNPKTLELLKHKRIDSAAIETKVILLEKEISALGIRIQMGFKLDPMHTCDTGALESKIREEFKGKWVDPRHDADALAKIYNTRAGRLVRSLNEKFSIFITPNSALIDIGKEFFGISERSIPYVASDKWLATMFWFKHPDAFKGLPEKMLITSAYGTMFSDNGYWKRFSERLEALHKQKAISEDDFILVRYDSDLLLRVHEISVDKGMNYSDDDIFDVVSAVRGKILSEKDAQIDEIRSETEERIAGIESQRKNIETKHERVLGKVEGLVNGISSATGWVVFSAITACILLVTYASTPVGMIPASIPPAIANGSIYLWMFIAATMIDLVGKLFNCSLHDIRIKVRESLKKRLRRSLLDD